MTGLQVRVFGKLRLKHGDASVDAFPTRRAEELLAFLLINQHTRHMRENLIDTLWPELPLSNGRASLSTALWRLRTVFDRLGFPTNDFLDTTRDWIRFELPESISLDLDLFQRHLAEAERIGDLEIRERALQAGIDLYQGVFCEGIYADWCLIERERLERLYLRALGQLMASLIQRCAYEEAGAIGQQILDRDPLREEVHRAIMVCHWKMGQPVQAVRQFQRCARLLQSELYIRPMPETIDLFRQIVEDRWLDFQADIRPATSYEHQLQGAYETFLAAAADLNDLLDKAGEEWREPITA